MYSKQELFDIIHENSNSVEGHLDNYYIPIPSDSKKVKKILKNICKNGQTNVGYLLKTIESRLQEVGVVVVNHVAYWSSDNYRLNYVFQTAKKCKQIDLPIKVYYHASQLEMELLA